MRISIVLEALTGTLETDLKRASKAAEKAAKEMRENFIEAGKVIGGALAAATTALTALTGKAINTADALDEMAQRVGISAQELSTLAYAAQRGGVDLGTFEAGMVKLTKAASDAARGTGEARAGFDALGVSVTNADGTLKSSDMLLRELAGKFAGLEDGANKTALAVNIFGRAGAQMIPILNQGADGIAAVQDEARALGLELTDATAALAGEFNDRLGDLQALSEGFGRQLAGQLLPALTDLATIAVENGKGMNAAAGGAETLANALKVVIAIAYTVKGAIEALVNSVAAFVDVSLAASKVAASIGDNLNPAAATMKLFGYETVSVADAVGEFKDTLLAAQGAAGQGVQDAIQGVSDAMTALFKPTTDAAAGLEQTTEAAKTVAPALAAAGEAADKAQPKTDSLGKAMKALADAQRAAVDGTIALVDELEQWQAQTDQVLDDLRFEADLIKMGNREREEAIALRQLGANATAEETEEVKRLLAELQNSAAIREAAEAFQSIWLDAANSVGDALTTALFDGAEAGADALMDVMKQLARDLVRFWLQQKIVIPLQQQLVGGPGGGGGLFGNAQLGQGFGGVAMGGLLGFGATGSIGGGLGGAAGSFLGNMFAPALASSIGGALGAALGSALPIVGTLLGAALGNALGGLFGSDPKPRLRINSSGAGIGNIGTRGTTALGSLAFNADDLSDTRGTERQLLQAIQALDQGFATLVGTFNLGQTQLDALRDAAGSWSIDLRNSAITAEAVLGSRFGALLNTFDEHIVSFVGSAGTLEERMGRLTEALFINAAAATGDLVDDFDTLVGLLDQFGAEGEAVDVTYRRLLQSTKLLEDALQMMGQSIETTREAFVTMAQEFVDAAGGIENATALWSGYFNRFFTEQERADLLVQRASQDAANEFADIGLAVEDFLGSDGMRRFRDLFQREFPNLTAAQRVEWLQAANALGFLNEALEDLRAIIDAIADAAATAAQRAANAFAQVGAPFGPGDDFNTPVGVNPYTPAPGAPVPTNATPPWMIPGMAGGPVIVNPGDPLYPGGSMGGPGSEIDREIDRRYERELEWLRRLADLQDSLLLDERLTTLTPAQQLAEIERQYQAAFLGALGGDEAARDTFDNLARQFADIGRGFFGSSAGYDQLFARILADIGTLRGASAATTAGNTVAGELARTGATPTAAPQNDQMAALRADFAAAMDQLVTIGERQVQLETRIANATEVTAQNTGSPQFPQRVIG